VAAVIQDALGVDAELQEGARGEFSVWVGEKRVAQKGPEGFPSEEEALAAVRKAMGIGN
jgi:hypothetical protein